MLVHNSNFNIKQIADSGQCFRMNKIDKDSGMISYSLIAYGRYLVLRQRKNDIVELSCSEEEFHAVWEDYFDMKYDYGNVTDELLQGEDEFLRQAAEFGHGVRILSQEPFEATISFIISQNKNIPAIKSCVEALCERYGEKKLDTEHGILYYTFPTPERLADAKREDLRSLKTGYRDEYIIRASQAVLDGRIDFEYLKYAPYEDSLRKLKEIHGIGEKVANCILLYGLHHIEGFPVDVWILKILKDIYQGSFNRQKYSGYAGIIQQYMFYYYRHLQGIT